MTRQSHINTICWRTKNYYIVHSSNNQYTILERSPIQCEQIWRQNAYRRLCDMQPMGVLDRLKK